MLRFTCPACSLPLSAPPECAGRPSKCRGCGQAFVVPVPVARLVEEQPPSPPRLHVRPWLLAALVLVLLGLVLLAINHLPSAAPNAKCPYCGETFHVKGLDDSGGEQGYYHRQLHSSKCPKCGMSHSLEDYREAWRKDK